MSEPALNRDALRPKAIGSIMGVFVGDALGLPLECKSPTEIRKHFGYVDRYVGNSLHKYAEVARRAAGSISDDSQLTLAVLDSIKRTRGIDLNDLRKSHIETFDGKWGPIVGWGRTTREAVSKMKENILDTTSPTGAGNGTCIKIAPLAVYSVYKCMQTQIGKFTNSFNASLLKKCTLITKMTHGDPRCIVVTYCQARMIIRALQNEIPFMTRKIASLFIQDAEYAEEHLKTNWLDDKLISTRLKQILTTESFEKITPVVSAEICHEQSSFVYNSYPLVAYCLSKYFPYKNFKYAVTETINAGADADSNGSMIGAIMGAHLGFESIPLEFIKGLGHWHILLSNVKEFEQIL